MPHLIVEYSANVADVVGIAALVEAIHESAIATGIAPLDGLRTRAACRDHYAIADRHPDNAFIAVTARLGAGRSDADKRRLIATLMDALTDHLDGAQSTMMLSVEYQEIDPDFRLNTNHVRARVAERAEEGTNT